MAGILIGKSYKTWQEYPITTSIATHPIDDLDFPVVTICPPKDSNTALYPDLVQAGNGTLSERDKATLKGSAFRIFMEQTHKEYVNKMLPMLYMGNMDQVLKGFHSLPNPYNQANSFEIKMWNINGTITTPWFGEDFVEDYYKEDREFFMVLQFPDDIKEQIGSGTLIIELEVDTREEKDWIEDVLIVNYTLHRTEKTWTEAEAECQREGGNLVSVISETVNEFIQSMAHYYESVWLGGRKELGEWSWADNSTWGFSDWKDGQSNGEDGSCVYTSQGGWWITSCTTTAERQFICQRTTAFVQKRKVNLSYTKDQLNYASFNVWYKYKAASQQLLDSWKEKKMTGFRFSWRIENRTVMWTSSVSKVGRSLQTPRLGEPVLNSADESSDHTYTAVLALPDEFQKEIGNGSLMIELVTDMRKEDEVAFSTSYILNSKSILDWDEAEAYCKSEGGHLASIHSMDQQALAEKAADGKHVWLGGWKEDAEWSWSDNSTWDFTNWDSATTNNNNNNNNQRMLLDASGKWKSWDDMKIWKFRPLCQGKITVSKDKGVTRIEMKKDDLKFLPLYITFKSPGVSKMMTNSSNGERRMSGFTLNWFLEDSNGNQLTKKLPPRKEDWTQKMPTPKYKQHLSEMVQLAKQHRLQNKTKEEILEEVIVEKVKNINILEEKGMCSMGQVLPKNHKRAFSKLVTLNSNPADGAPSDEDIKTGYELFQIIFFCPTMIMKLFRFYDHLISSESSRTIIQTFVNIFKSGAITDEASFTLAKQLYFILASTLNLQYGNVLLATSTNAHLQAMVKNDWPFFANRTDLVGKCIDANGVLRELSLHPIHLTPDKEGNLPPSALVPCCSYQGDSSFLGQERLELDNLAICDKFVSTILECQLCHSLDIAKLGAKTTKSGKNNGLLLLLDPDPYQSSDTAKRVGGSRTGAQSFKVFIHTLGQSSTFGPGSYGMKALKKMTGTERFEQLPDHEKKCVVHNREECQTLKYLDQVQAECNCTPWALQTEGGKNPVK